ncbi:MAG: sugar transferase [Salinivirgaceae bacterium]|nr:sugar transferase [Salinivirgaceae bacterium]
MYTRFFKRATDIVVSTIIFAALSPIFVIVTILLAIVHKGQPFFFQLRPGKDEKVFKIIKFKTMTDQQGPDGKLLPDCERLTLIGSFVRKTSLDEIPQLLNVIKGEMSLIGPRPLLVEYLPYYTNEEKLRHVVRPGITGWAQVNGRNNIDWDSKLSLDVYYVNNISLKLDSKIIPMTIKNVITQKNVNVVPTVKNVKLDDYRRNKSQVF